MLKHKAHLSKTYFSMQIVAVVYHIHENSNLDQVGQKIGLLGNLFEKNFQKLF